MRDAITHAAKALIRDHHEALLAEIFGAGVVPAARVEVLIRQGVMTPQQIGAARIPLGDGVTTVDPFEYMRLVSLALEKMTEGERERARDNTLASWQPYVLQEFERARAEAPLNVRARLEQQEAWVATMAERPPDLLLSKPSPPVVQADSGTPPAPAWMSITDQRAHAEALSRAGVFARGLGNVYADDVGQRLAEVWDAADLVTPADETQRGQMLGIIREKTAGALSHQDARKLGRDLADATQHYSHGWQRIAQTELQGAYNLGVVEAAIDAYGEDGRVVRIPETGACPHCIRLFQGEDGPRVFTVRELLENGTNVGRRADAWLPTAWPVHPNCRCDTRSLPPGYKVAKDGRFAPPEVTT